MWPIYRWAAGETLSKVLASGVDAEMPAGDFVRWARQVVDLLGQIAEAAGGASTADHRAGGHGRAQSRCAGILMIG